METANKEAMKWPSNKSQYDRNYTIIFGADCTCCKGKGYHQDWCEIQKKYVKATCLICNGTGKRR